MKLNLLVSELPMFLMFLTSFHWHFQKQSKYEHEKYIMREEIKRMFKILRI